MSETRSTSVSVSSWGWTERGDREGENEDAFLNWPERKFWSVADGMGGTTHGAAASRLLIRSFLQLREQDSLKNLMEKTKNIILDSNQFLFSQKQAGTSAGSTVVTLMMHAGEAACVWAGDSRCYLLRDETLYQCTHDHTLRQDKIDRRELTENEAKRMVRANIITNAVGVSENPRLDEVRFKLRTGDRFLLCSDGLTRIVSEPALTRMLSKPTPKECSDAIQHSIKDMPQPDNVTFVAVYLTRRS